MTVYVQLKLPHEPPVAVWSTREGAERAVRARLGDDFFADADWETALDQMIYPLVIDRAAAD